MFSLTNLRRLCAAIDAFAATCIAASISKARTKTDIAISAQASNDNFPTIAACKAAALKKQVKQEAVKDPSLCAVSSQDSIPLAEPALVQIKAERDPEKLFQLFNANAENRLVVENRFAFEDTVSRLKGARRFDLIEKLLEHQRTLPQGRREGFVLRIIMLYGRARMADHALRTFEEMHLFGCPQTAKSFNAVLKVLSENRRFEEAQVLFSKALTKFGIELDVISYNTIIKVLCEMDSLDSAYLVMLKMEKAKIMPDVVTYTTLMSAFYKHGHREVGDGLWNLMVLKGCSPNLATYNVRIQFLINRRRGWQANDLVQKMTSTGIRPDELTYNLIIKGFCMMGELDMAKRIFLAMDGRGCKPNEKVYQTMVHYFCKGGLMKISKEGSAREIFKLVRKKQPPYSIEELKAFQDILFIGKTL
ncbi:pentatricopeptide repeat-containing protein At1g80150, mitochondrial isoform X2 [Phalaenopsis equestris]|uniref:pentatricopeptide repeat-containing protein At1g80150, mitochondrial isoform X2 n=1 Tax=Phalaenopsis equestris TaxID=78828 RepID=UPI0009E4A1DE|nr:pentatricopeptide repeat-containing protein At1g80150, mitochondrial isoform X2 [Phalaenopsis equestris]